MRGKRDEKNNQIKVVWNVENLKVSFVNSFELTSLQDIYQAYMENSQLIGEMCMTIWEWTLTKEIMGQ